MTDLSRRESLSAIAALVLAGCGGRGPRAKPAPPSTRETIVLGHYNGQQISRQTYEGVRFERCSFDEVSGRYRKNSVEHTEFHACVFTSCCFDDCTFTGAQFSRCHFRNCTFSGGTLTDVLFMDNKARGLTFDGVTIATTGFDGGELANIFFTDCRIDALSFLGIKADDLTLTTCGDVKKLTFITSELRDAVITDTNLEEARSHQTHFYDARFSNGRYSLFELLESTVDGTRFEKVQLVGANISETIFTEPAFEDVTFAKFLVAQKTIFRKARIVRPVLETGVRIKPEEMVIEGGDRL